MSALKIRVFPDKILRKKAAKISCVTDSEIAAFADMAETMYINNGIGLAALQVGIDKQLAVVDIGSGIIRMANPVIVKRIGAVEDEEGCLSVPDACVKVKRARSVTVSFLNEKNEVVELRADGLLARAVQHEIDHLSGFLIIDHLPPIKKFFLRAKLPGSSRIKGKRI
ncbi:MAG: peptide deformylase [Candidatus Omnitrophota bacterium]|nr:peptide deformylase [Candidatus Omnitrophota bacterium]